MTPIQTNLCNFTYTAPPGMTKEQCGNLPCVINPEQGTITSFWQLSPEERQEIADGALVAFTVFSHHHPVVSLATASVAIQQSSLKTPAPLLTQEELFQAMRKLIDHIEACGGSPQLTTTVMLANDISHAIGNQWNHSNEYAAQRVREIIAPAQS